MGLLLGNLAQLKPGRSMHNGTMTNDLDILVRIIRMIPLLENLPVSTQNEKRPTKEKEIPCHDSFPPTYYT